MRVPVEVKPTGAQMALQKSMESLVGVKITEVLYWLPEEAHAQCQALYRLEFANGGGLDFGEWRIFRDGMPLTTSARAPELPPVEPPTRVEGTLGTALRGKKIRKLKLDSATGDLWIFVDEGIGFQALNMLPDLEAWHLTIKPGTGEYSNYQWEDS